MGVPRVDLSSYAPDDDALALVPAARRARAAHPAAVRDRGHADRRDRRPDGRVRARRRRGASSASSSTRCSPTPPPPRPRSRSTTPPRAEEPAAAPRPPPSPPPAERRSRARLVEPEPQPVRRASRRPPSSMPDEAEPPPPPRPCSPRSRPRSRRPSRGAGEAHTMEEVAAADVAAGGGRIDLDVLAVADSRKVAVLVADILEDAAARGASRIHLLPYKDDFFLVYRIDGRLEKVATRAALDAGRARRRVQELREARLGARRRCRRSAASTPASATRTPCSPSRPCRRSRASASSSRSRRSASGAARARRPRHDARRRRARCTRWSSAAAASCCCARPSPPGGARPTTRCSTHAATAGKTVYSVERSVEYEIPAVAQVHGEPGLARRGRGATSPPDCGRTPTSSPIDGLQTAEEIHLAVEAAGLGKLVIATFAAGDIVSGVRRMLDLGAEPVSLAAALTLGVGQRLVRTNCPNCTRRAAQSARGAGSPACRRTSSSRRAPAARTARKTGFRGMTGIFEVLPFTEPVARGRRARRVRGGARRGGEGGGHASARRLRVSRRRARGSSASRSSTAS